MSDIYDYVYAHTMRQQEQCFNNNTTAKDALKSEGEDRDWKQDKCERKKKIKKRQVTCLDSSTCSSLHDEDIGSLTDMCSSSEDLCDQGYYNRPLSALSLAACSNSSTNVSNDSSDSEDSGIYTNSSTTGSHLYENFKPLASRISSTANKPLSKISLDRHIYENSEILHALPSCENKVMASCSKRKSLKSRLLSLIKMKRSFTKIGQQSGCVVNAGVIAQPQANQSKKSKSQSKFLIKAMRLLTL